jgi:hypothetical protein
MKSVILTFTVVIMSALCLTNALAQGHSEPFPITTATGSQDYFQAAYNPNNDDYLVVWQDDRNGETDIYGQLIDWDGTPIGDNIAVCAAAGSQQRPRLDFDPILDRYLVVFEDTRNAHPGGIYGAFVGSDGTIQPVASSEADGSFPISTAAGEVFWPSIAFNFLENTYLVVWGDSRNDPGNALGADVFGQRVAADGTLLGPPDPADANVNFAIADTEIEESVTDVSYSSVTNEWFVVYGTDLGIVMGQRVNHLGQLLNPDGTVAVSKPSKTSQENSAITITLPFLNSTLCLRTVVTFQTVREDLVKAAHLETECLVAWKGRFETALDNDVYCQRVGFFLEEQVYVARLLDVGGNVTENPAHIPVCLAPDWQEPVDIAYSVHDNEYLLAWGDPRERGFLGQDLYCQRLWLNESNEMVMLADDRVNTVTNLENILLAGTDDYEGADHGVAYNRFRNEFLVVYKYAKTTMAKSTSATIGDGNGQRVKGSTPSAVGEKTVDIIPDAFQLSQNYPNPFNPVTTIEFRLPSSERAMIRVFDMMGREIVTLVDQNMAAGTYQVTWNGRDGSGMEVSSGVYFYRLEAGAYTATEKMVLIR